MPRAISSALQVELSKPVTRVGYLVELSTSPVLRWCDVGTVNWNGFVWVAYDLQLSGLGGSAERAGNVSLTVQNLDNAAAASLIDADMSSVICDVYQIAPAATAVEDVVHIGRYMLGDMEIEVDSLKAELVPENSLQDFSPRRRIDPSFGFKFALPEGTQIVWENEIYVVEPSDG